MKSYELQPTYDNIFDTFIEDSIGRDRSLYWFIEILNSIEDSCSIALEGHWGSGKTFFVKQVKMVLDALNHHLKNTDKENRESIISTWNTLDKDSNVNWQPQVSVYYDAWANDNDEEPLLSLVYQIIKSISDDYSFKKGTDCLRVVGGIIDFFTGKKINALVDAIKSEDPLAELKKQKDIHAKIEEFLDSLLVEQGNRLVILIDELDRCKPSYAVRLLERIKHYFTNERITFVFSININELQHTIKQHYGNDFNSCKYLDRFFDLRIALPSANMEKFYQSMNFSKSSFVYDSVAFKVIEKYHFSLREISKYLRLIKIAGYDAAHNNKYDFSFSDGNAKRFSLLMLVPIMLGLKINDMSRYTDFVQGRDHTPLIEILEDGDIGMNMCSALLNSKETYDNAIEGQNKVELRDKLQQVYNALFVYKYDNRRHETKIGQLSFSNNTKIFLENVVSLLSKYANTEV